MHIVFTFHSSKWAFKEIEKIFLFRDVRCFSAEHRLSDFTWLVFEMNSICSFLIHVFCTNSIVRKFHLINLENEFGITESFINSSWEQIFYFIIISIRLVTFALFAQRIFLCSGLISSSYLILEFFAKDSLRTSYRLLSIRINVVSLSLFQMTMDLFVVVSDLDSLIIVGVECFGLSCFCQLYTTIHSSIFRCYCTSFFWKLIMHTCVSSTCHYCSYFHLLINSMQYHTIFNFTSFTQFVLRDIFSFKHKTSSETSSISKYLIASLCWQNLHTWPTENSFEKLFVSANFFKNANFLQFQHYKRHLLSDVWRFTDLSWSLCCMGLLLLCQLSFLLSLIASFAYFDTSFGVPVFRLILLMWCYCFLRNLSSRKDSCCENNYICSLISLISSVEAGWSSPFSPNAFFLTTRFYFLLWIAQALCQLV